MCSSLRRLRTCSVAGAPKKLSDLATHDFVLYRPQAGKNVLHRSPAKGDESVEVTGPLGADNLLFNRNAVAAGAGISLFPAVSVRKYVERGHEGEGASRLYRSRAALSTSRQQLTRVKLLRDFLVANLLSCSTPCNELLARAASVAARGSAKRGAPSPRSANEPFEEFRPGTLQEQPESSSADGKRGLASGSAGVAGAPALPVGAPAVPGWGQISWGCSCGSWVSLFL